MIYAHNHPESKKSKAYKRILKLMGANKKLHFELETGRFIGKKPAHLHKAHYEEFNIDIHKVEGRDVYTLGPKSESDLIVLYLHGGAFVHNLLRVHWNMIFDLIRKTGATFVVPDYPLAPDSHYWFVYQMVGLVYDDIVNDLGDKHFVAMGDSAGGGLALGLLQKKRDEGAKKLAQVVMLSPWLDLTMLNPEAKEVEGHDILLKVEGLRRAGALYAGDDSAKEPMISPLFGSCKGLGTISFFSSSDDVLVADSHALVKKLEQENIPFNYYEYPKMFHGWMTIVGMEESQSALHQIAELITNQ